MVPNLYILALIIRSIYLWQLAFHIPNLLSQRDLKGCLESAF